MLAKQPKAPPPSAGEKQRAPCEGREVCACVRRLIKFETANGCKHAKKSLQGVSLVTHTERKKAAVRAYGNSSMYNR